MTISLIAYLPLSASVDDETDGCKIKQYNCICTVLILVYYVEVKIFNTGQFG